MIHHSPLQDAKDALLENQRIHPFHRGLRRLLAASAVGLLACGMSPARNANLSNHITNLSESAAATAPGWEDFATEILVEGQIVHTFWMSNHPDGGVQLNYRRSLDGGRTWQPPYTFYRQDLVLKDPLRDEDLKRMTVIDGTVHIAFGAYGGEGGGWFGRLVYLRSLDNGATFEAPRYLWSSNVPNPAPWHAYDVYIASGGGRVAISARIQANWYDHLSAHVYISSDHGTTFSETVAATGGGGGGWSVDDFYFNGDEVALLYSQSYFYYGLQWCDLYVSASDDGGATFRQQRISVPSSNGNHKTLGAHDYHYSPKIMCSGGRIDVVWHGLDAADTQAIFYRRSPDGGRTWENAINLTAGTTITAATLHSQHTLATDGDQVFVLIPTNASRLFLRRSTNGGLTFGPCVEVTDPAGNSIAEGTWWPVMKRVPSGVAGVTALDIVGNGVRRFRSLDNGQTFTVTTIGPTWSYSAAYMSQFATDGQGNTHVICKAKWTWYSTGVFGDFDTLYARIDREPVPSSGNRALQVVSTRNLGDGSGNERYDGLLAPDDGSLVSRDALTIEFWTRIQLTTSGTESYCLQKQGPANGGSWETILIGNWRSGEADARIATDDGGYVLVGGGQVVDGQWHHIAITYDSAQSDENFRLFVDGRQVAATAASGLLKAGKGPVLIGGGSDNRADGTVAMDEVRIWNRALDGDTIRSRMSQPLNGSEDGLLAWYPLNGSNRDASGHGHHAQFLYKESFVPGVVSPVSSLTDLALSQGSLTPSFAPETTDYTASVDGSVAAITVTPTAADARATVRVNGASVPSGTASAPIPLAAGENPISVQVTAPDGSTVTTYTVTVTRAPSTISRLSSLETSSGTLSPAFDENTTEYTLRVPGATTRITISPTLADASATILVNGVTMPPGTTSMEIPLVVGETLITLVVRAQDGTTMTTYTVVVTREAASDARLRKLEVKGGKLSPKFKPGMKSYHVAVSKKQKSLRLRPVAMDRMSLITINGKKVKSGSFCKPVTIKKKGKTLIRIQVTAQDDTRITYRITVRRITR